ncbi:MAG: radical SAM protein [Planctomycetota bacterium]|nr:MAG: radical SAM protein [Planctomycetota bacterium]
MNAKLERQKQHNSRVLREDVLEQRSCFRALPEVIALHTTERCNLRCGMCVRSLGQGTRQLPTADLVRLCDDLFPTARKVALSAAAGEPLLADFEPVLDRALAHGVRVDVVTNGLALTPELYAAAAPVFDHVNVSIDSADPRTYELIRVDGSFERLDRNLTSIGEHRRARPDGVLLTLSAVVMRTNLERLDELVDYARRIGADGLILQRLRHSGLAVPHLDPSTSPGPAAVQAALDRVRARAVAAQVSVSFSDFGQPNHFARPVRDKVPPELTGAGICSFVAQHFGVQPTGEVYACCYPTDHRLGDLRTQRAAEIWNGAAAQALRTAHFSRRGSVFCRGCAHAPHLSRRGPAWWNQWWKHARLRWALVRAPLRARRAERATRAS